MESDAPSPHRELAYRVSGGIEVVLFWHQGTDELLVSVSDQRSGAYFELAAAPDQALDVFNHPYAHAAFRGLPYENASIPCWAEAGSTHGHIGPDLSERPTR
jgi:hypothetical protein